MKKITCKLNDNKIKKLVEACDILEDILVSANHASSIIIHNEKDPIGIKISKGAFVEMHGSLENILVCISNYHHSA